MVAPLCRHPNPTLPPSPRSTSPSQCLQWEKEPTNKLNKRGQPIKKLKLKSSHPPPVALVLLLLNLLAPHALHCYAIKQQATAFKACQEGLVAGEVMVLADFSEKLTLAPNNQTQDAYFGGVCQDATLLNFVVWYRPAGSPELLRESHTYISSDPTQDHW